MAVDVVVVNYHTEQLLHEFVESYDREKFDGCTLTIVDVEVASDGSHVHEMCDSFVLFHENVGYARACNAGASGGNNDVILLANSDTRLVGLKECYDQLVAHDDWGVLGPRQVNEFGNITAGGIFGTDTNIGQRGWNEVDRGQYSDVRDDAKSVSGSLYFIKRNLWNELTECPLYKGFVPDAIGAFLPTKHYWEETFCSYHARAHSYKVVYYGPVQMIHYWHKSSPIGVPEMYVDESKALYRAACQAHGIVHE